MPCYEARTVIYNTMQCYEHRLNNVNDVGCRQPQRFSCCILCEHLNSFHCASCDLHLT